MLSTLSLALTRAARNCHCGPNGWCGGRHQRREDIPLHFALAENWIVGDAYHESITAATNPNRVAWLSGSVNVPGNGKLSSDLGGPVFDNHVSEGCELSTPDGPKYTCFPFKWKTVPEYLEELGISWQVYQDTDNFDDNPLAHFTTFSEARNDSSLAKRGMSFIGLDKFYEDARSGNLPQVSYIVGPTDLSEHPPYSPLDGAWLQQQVVDALLASPKWESTALLLSYDETGGTADHVYGPVPPRDAPGEWVPVDPFTPSLGAAPVGPGFRLPFYIISPYTRNGGVFTEVATHESQNLFLEEWAAALGKPFQVEAVPSWRRSTLSNLVKAFDFSRADTSSPDDPPRIRKASQDSQTGAYNGAAVCAAKYPNPEPEIPYSKNTNVSDALYVEQGFKAVRGDLTEGRYLVFETLGKDSTDSLAMAYDEDGKVRCVKADTQNHAEPSQRFVLYATDSAPNNRIFRLSNTESYVKDKQYVGADFDMVGEAAKAAQFLIEDLGYGKGHQVKLNGQSVQCSKEGAAPSTDKGSSSAFSVFAVTY